MSLILEKDIKNLLKKYKVHPLKRLGQNFLIDKGVVKKIIESAQLSKNDIILEIGPGMGNLTIELAKKAKRVIAIEKDPKMIEILGETLEGFDNVEIIQGDILKIFNFQLSIFNKFSIFNYKVVANLPFYLTAPVIRKFLESENRPKEMVLVVQKEVGQRICAKPPEMSILAVSVQFYVHPLKSNEAGAKQFNGAGPEIIAFISKKSFYPPPRTDGAILKISAFNQREKSAFNQWFFKIVKAGFSHPRKQLINNLSGGLKMDRANVKSWLLKNNIRPEQRAETLAVEDWINLAKSLRIGVNLGLN